MCIFGHITTDITMRLLLPAKNKFILRLWRAKLVIIKAVVNGFIEQLIFSCRNIIGAVIKTFIAFPRYAAEFYILDAISNQVPRFGVFYQNIPPVGSAIGDQVGK